MKTYSELFEKEEFKTAVISGDLCIFLGAGVAQNIGMPTWENLAKKILNFTYKHSLIGHSSYVQLLKSGDCIKIISLCEKEINKNNKEKEFNDLLADIFYNKPKDKFLESSVYQDLRKIHELRKVLIIQANYDVMLEKYQTPIESENSGFYVPYLNENFEDNKNNIIYLHGRFDGSCEDDEFKTYENLILTKKQYNEIYVLENNEKYILHKKFFKEILKNYSLLFLGYSLKDIEIMQMIANAGEREKYKKINLIVDCCSANKTDQENEAEYLTIASDGKLNIYEYSTEKNGYGEFEDVIAKLKEKIYAYSNENANILKYTNSEEVDFD